MTDVTPFRPLKPDVFEILIALAEGELHGYGLLKVLESRDIRIAASLLYRKLRRLMEEELVSESPRTPVAGDDPRRRYYRLTPLGLAVVRAEAARIVELAGTRHIRQLAEGASYG
jgi:DNA-binding PadR family transcriptional regulator